MFAVVAIFYLNCVVCQMDEFVFEVFQIKDLGTCSDISLLVPKKFSYSLDAQQKHIGSDIKFSLLIKKNASQIFLYDVRSFSIALPLLHFFLDLFNTVRHKDSSSPIAVFSRLNYPNGIFVL